MADESAKERPTQKTLKGTEIPLPKRSEIMEAFKKIVQPQKRES